MALAKLHLAIILMTILLSTTATTSGSGNSHHRKHHQARTHSSTQKDQSHHHDDVNKQQMEDVVASMLFRTGYGRGRPIPCPGVSQMALLCCRSGFESCCPCRRRSQPWTLG